MFVLCVVITKVLASFTVNSHSFSPILVLFQDNFPAISPLARNREIKRDLNSERALRQETGVATTTLAA